MLSSIHPFGERSRNSRWWLTISFYLAGSVAGGLAMGLVAGAVGVGVRSAIDAGPALLLLAGLGLLGLAADLGLGGLRLPSMHRQVNERWLTQYRGWVYGGGFGFQLGTGVVTIITTSTVWLTWLGAAFTGSIPQALLIGAVFGLARGSFIFATIRINDPSRLRALHRKIDQQAAAVNRAAMASAAAITLGAAVVGLGGVL